MQRNFIYEFFLTLGRSQLLPHRLRPILYKAGGVGVENGVFLREAIHVVGRGQVVIGGGSFINAGTYLDATDSIIIGSNVSIGNHARLITSTHVIDGPAKRAGALHASPIHIGDGTWIGSGVTILPGISVGSGCIIAAGSIVTRDCLSNTLYAGVPAKRQRPLDS